MIFLLDIIHDLSNNVFDGILNIQLLGILFLSYFAAGDSRGAYGSGYHNGQRNQKDLERN
jgi:hypothetical protein